jgi:hypothetical protein
MFVEIIIIPSDSDHGCKNGNKHYVLLEDYYSEIKIIIFLIFETFVGIIKTVLRNSLFCYKSSIGNFLNRWKSC